MVLPGMVRSARPHWMNPSRGAIAWRARGAVGLFTRAMDCEPQSMVSFLRESHPTCVPTAMRGQR